MKQNLYVLLLTLCVCMVSCNGNDNDPKAYDPDLKNLNRYYVQVGDDKPMQVTRLLYSKSTQNGYDVYGVSIDGENEDNRFGIGFTLACNDPNNLTPGDYPYIGFSWPSGLAMYKGFCDYTTASRESIYNTLEVGGMCRVTKSGNDYVCEFEGTVNKNGDISNRNSMRFKVTLNEQMRDSNYTVPY